MKDLILKHLQGPKVLILFVLTNIVYVVMLVFTIPLVLRHAEGMKLLDMMPTGYSQAYVNWLLDTLGKEGRDAYLTRQIPVDLIYPFLFAVSYCLLFAYLLKRINLLHSKVFNFSYLPLLAGMFDYCENFGIVTILNLYPSNPGWVSLITAFFSIAKSMLSTVYFFALIFIFLRFLYFNVKWSGSKS